METCPIDGKEKRMQESESLITMLSVAKLIWDQSFSKPTH